MESIVNDKKKEQKTIDIINEYKLMMNSFFPNNKSPSFFVKKLEYRMIQYYNVYNSKI
jgi:hypothetical protein